MQGLVRSTLVFLLIAGCASDSEESGDADAIVAEETAAEDTAATEPAEPGATGTLPEEAPAANEPLEQEAQLGDASAPLESEELPEVAVPTDASAESSPADAPVEAPAAIVEQPL